MKRTFSGKIALVTGGASGLGRGLCEALARHGAKLFIADIDLPGVDQLAERLRAQGAEVEACRIDVGDAASVESLVERAVQRFGRIDYMFNNAGITVVGKSQHVSAASLQRVIGINLLGAAYGTLFAYRKMLEQGSGHIVNIASMYALFPGPLASAYVAAKQGLSGLTKSIMIEAEQHSIRLTLVCPGYIATNLFRAGYHAGGLNANNVVSMIPVKLLDVETAVARTLKAVSVGKRIAVFPAYARVLWWIERISPAALLWLLRMAMRDQQRRMEKALRRAGRARSDRRSGPMTGE